MNPITELADLDQLIEDLATRIADIRLPAPGTHAQSDFLLCDLTILMCPPPS
ncbi:hypothetical protein LX15_000759 [Streptoalloteichus tenebrarius]|uniref:Transposase n=1 Tax=Streptoalloteichus tenebrarius (strain ATCC 17920 / DSM 40477 / JCM 4838 / CBS 697.72 / NBRC 16177 / NCIMB 11028 / NRRL B-12390 / A12253. 1 / ISP 5477) TaxID=1933 RepID=A0ABT1HNI7_STRSD|nr:hypothetical protein [Streptoalloteichus tenebrarius]MCP2257074.1 hypothetical protein [Streptoalloteichus tenebrarius]BFE98705.1 hypothetical protein GCM10020241_03810 [Streptoalloteichus tenebrarius]